MPALMPNHVNEYIEDILAHVAPEVATKVREMYDKEQTAFTEAALKVQPSTEPKYWAKPSCNRCHGTGTCGTAVICRDIITCTCATKRYQKWLTNYRVQYVREKQNGS